MRRPFIYVGLSVAVLFAPSARAERSGGDSDHGDGRPVYQRHAFDRKDKDDHRFRRRRFFPHFFAPEVKASWFQRPYPYHLDYYKMRYGGSYAPYFGNLYGPPQVVTAPPYYGPYYGNFGYGDPNGFAQPGAYGATPGSFGLPNGPIVERSAAAPENESGQPANGEGLPAPQQ